MKRHSVYRIYAANGDLLYVGMSLNVDNRLAAHRMKWLHKYPGHTVRVDGPHTRAQATVLERRAIITETPKRNKAWRFYRDPEIISECMIAAPTAAKYLVGSEPRVEGYCELIVSGFGLQPVDVPEVDHTGWRAQILLYRLLDIEAKYLELNEVAA